MNHSTYSNNTNTAKTHSSRARFITRFYFGFRKTPTEANGLKNLINTMLQA